MEELSPGTIAAIGGLIAGLGMGFAARWGNFCTLGAIEDAIFGSNYDRIRMWTLIIGVAMFGTFVIDHLGLIDITQSIYLTSSTSLAAVAIGSVVFGLGMSLVGTCGFGALVRIGGGDLKSIITFLVMGIFAYATLSGVTAYLRIGLFPEQNTDRNFTGIAHIAGNYFSISPNIIAYLVAVGLALFALKTLRFRQQPKRVLASVLMGLMIVWGWISTGVFAFDEFEPYRLESLTFSAPLGETIMYVMTMSGASLKFGIGATFGVVIGAAITSMAQGYFRWEGCDDPRELKRQLVGGMLMGIGGVTALGCTIGQGVSAFSTLAISAPIALIGIFCGAWIGLHFLIHGSITEAFQYLLASHRDDK
ncbi:MAG: YeeE/YedE family protein [Hyphomicrobiales bacterium]|nr:YeeE/YedE family protein [Hyphomicrobiales bacterium]